MKKEFNLSFGQSDFLKLVAIILMTVDHIGMILYPDVVALRIIGRLAFFIFAYQLAYSFNKTRDPKKFALRLLLFAIISQLPYYFAVGGNLNILFTLFLGFVAIWLTKKFGILVGLIILPLAQICNVDYGFYGVGVILISYLLQSRIYFLALAQTILFPISLFVFGLLGGMSWVVWFEPVGFLVYPLIVHSPSLPFRLNKYFFYAFYPIHLLVLYIIMRIYF